MSAIFAGLKVIDCASFIAAPGAATVLADFGADVLKVEPIGGDTFRNLWQTQGQPRAAENYPWLQANRSRRGLALKLGTPDGNAVLHRLVEGADVFITNTPFPARRRLGIDYAALAPLNERLIYASFSAYGETGHEADKPGFDSLAWWARSGLMDQVKGDASLPPGRSVPGMGDYPSAMAFYGAIVTALYRRERTGRGGHVSSHLMVNGLWSNAYLAQAKLCGADIPKRVPREQSPNPLMCHYRTRDDRWLIVSLLNGDEQWPVLAERLGLGPLKADARFATGASRAENAPELIAIIDDIVAGRTLGEWRAILDGHGLTFGFVANLDDMLTDPQVAATDTLVSFENEELMTVNSPIFVDGETKRQPSRAPAIGEHSDQVLEELGFSREAVAEMRAKGIVAG